MHEVVFYLRLTTGTTISNKAEALAKCRQLLEDELAKAELKIDSEGGLFGVEVIGEHAERLWSKFQPQRR